MESNNGFTKEGLRGTQEVAPKKALRGPGKTPNRTQGAPRRVPKRIQEGPGRDHEGEDNNW
jgi:hypothetical protein